VVGMSIVISFQRVVRLVLVVFVLLLLLALDGSDSEPISPVLLSVVGSIFSLAENSQRICKVIVVLVDDVSIP